MKQIILLSFFYFMFICNALMAQDVVGFWKAVDDKSGRPQSIVAVYEYQGKYYAKIIAKYDNYGNIQDTIYNPIDRAPGVRGNPYYSGLDIIWNLQPSGPKYTKGKILDPEKGKVYDSQMWRQGDNLIVRGEILCFGRNITWPPAYQQDFPQGFQIPDLSTMVPSIPQVR